MKDETRKRIRKIVSDFIDNLPNLDETKLEELRKAKPFQAAMFSDEALLYSSLERSIVTRMGTTLYPSLAEAIALDSHKDVNRNYPVSGSVDSGMLAEIERIVADLREGGGKRKPEHDQEMKEIENNRTGRAVTVRVIADLYVGDHEEGPLFMEIKSPMPNLDVCAESKKKVLLFELIKRGEGGRGYFAFAYNPYIKRSKYAWSFTKHIMDMEQEVLMGVEMWDKLGGEGTFIELMKVVEIVGEENRRELEASTQKKVKSGTLFEDE